MQYSTLPKGSAKSLTAHRSLFTNGVALSVSQAASH